MTEQKPSDAVLSKEQGSRDEENDLPTKAESENDAEAEFQRLVKSAPAPMRHIMMQMTRLQGAGSFPHPIIDKFTPQHVDKFLDYSHDDEVNAYTFARSNRWFHLAYALLFVALLVFLIIYLAPTQKDLLSDILKMLAVFAGGFGAGFGTKSFFGKKG